MHLYRIDKVWRSARTGQPVQLVVTGVSATPEGKGRSVVIDILHARLCREKWGRDPEKWIGKVMRRGELYGRKKFCPVSNLEYREHRYEPHDEEASE